MKPLIKIKFVDFWPGFPPERNYFTELLMMKYTVEISDEPDLLFYSVYGNDYLRYNCFRVFYAPENERPDFSGFDFGFGFDFIDREDYMRLPLYVFYLDADFNRVSKKGLDLEKVYEQKNKFCNFVISNPRAHKRIDFFKKLSKYKKVDSGGRHLNNIGGPIQDKESFISQYKFTLAFENSSFPGYTTEKLVQPMKKQSIPVYWGNTVVEKDFNTKSFINWHDYNNDEKVIEAILKIDGDKSLYMQYLQEEYITSEKLLAMYSHENMLHVFDSIIYKAKNTKPKALTFYEKVHKANLKKRKVAHLIRRGFGLNHFR